MNAKERDEKRDEATTGIGWWSDRAWIKFGLVLSGIVMLVVLAGGDALGTDVKMVAAIAILIPLHVVEEWVFPGGFHYQYNCLQKSPVPDRYPMCRVSDMFTNLVTTLFYIGLAAYSVAVGAAPTGVMLGTVIFCGLEVVVHTVFGVMMWQKFRDKGKTTIYGAGSVTAYFGFLSIGATLAQQLAGRSIAGTDWVVAVALLAFIAVVCILIPEGAFKSEESPYGFKSAGYYERFMA